MTAEAPALAEDFVGIKVDDREARSGVKIVRGLRAEAPITTEHMFFADYAFRGAHREDLDRRPTIGIEVASLSDFCGKVATVVAGQSRFVFQAAGMRERFDVCYHILKGKLRPDDKGYVKIWGADTSGMSMVRARGELNLASAYGVQTIETWNEEEVVWEILHLWKLWNKPVEEHKAFRKVHPVYETSGMPTSFLPLAPELAKHVEALSAYPEIGYQRALDAIRTLGSLQLLHIMPVEQLETIPGWGPTTARKFKRFIAERPFDA